MSDWVTDIVRSFGYAGIALLAFLENVFPPIPSELIMPLAGYMAAQGEMSLTGAIAAGSLGTLAGAVGWYFVGVRIGEQRLRRWVERNGHWLTLSNEDIDKAQAELQRHGSAVVFFGRLIPGIRTWVSVPAGLARMSFLKFLAYSAAGTVIWTSLLTYGGHVLGQSFPDIEKYLGNVSTAVFVIIGIWYVWRLVRHMRAEPSRQSR